ncbi:hypothetical protein JRI60_14895 [Archangium violaceum]|uniref:hypothetical protein n=1 Tax=Archangium violaceum TaxID=83451 RepID=UPI00194F402E|nr:hypothetical protein [Archangium violaceum]QRO00209.1 hypothetical protein JRI60_14895 [Archangium violaceum]
MNLERLKLVSGLVLALTVAVAVPLATNAQVEQSPVAPAVSQPSSDHSACKADKEKLLMSRAKNGIAADAPVPLFSEEPVGLLGYCSYDCSSCSSSRECAARGAGSCYSICP